MPLRCSWDGAQLFLKAGTNAAPVGLGLALEPRILAGIACYAVSLVVWILALSKHPSASPTRWSRSASR